MAVAAPAARAPTTTSYRLPSRSGSSCDGSAGRRVVGGGHGSQFCSMSGAENTRAVGRTGFDGRPGRQRHDDPVDEVRVATDRSARRARRRWASASRLVAVGSRRGGRRSGGRATRRSVDGRWPRRRCRCRPRGGRAHPARSTGGRGDRFPIEHLAVQTEALGRTVDAVEDPTHPPVGRLDQHGENPEPSVARFLSIPCTPSDQADASRLQRGQIEVSAVGSSDQLQRRRLAGRGHVVDGVERPVEDPDQVEPPEDVPAPEVRGNRLWLPTARVTWRPAACSSAASCTPVADAPTTSTPPSPRSSGFR